MVRVLALVDHLRGAALRRRRRSGDVPEIVGIERAGARLVVLADRFDTRPAASYEVSTMFPSPSVWLMVRPAASYCVIVLLPAVSVTCQTLPRAS